MNIPVVQGRAFNERDTETAPLVMIINQALAGRDFPNENPIGKRINLGNMDPKGQPVWWEIVGVAANVRSLELREEATPEFYLSALQDTFRNMFVVVRTSVEPTSVAASVRRAAAEVDKSAAVSDVKTMEHIVNDAVTQPRFNLFLLGLLVELRCCCQPPVFTELPLTASRSARMSLAFGWRSERKSATC